MRRDSLRCYAIRERFRGRASGPRAVGRQHRHDDPVVRAAARSGAQSADSCASTSRCRTCRARWGNLTQLLGELDSNIVDIAHQRAFGGSSVRAAIVELTLQMRGEEQADRVLAALKGRGYEAKEVEG